jgi:Isopentenyldiphosphate isomerase
VELHDVYNRNGELTGKITVSSKTLNDGEYCLGVHAYVRNNNGEFLIQKRKENKSFLPGAWYIHMGHVIAGETSVDGILRELREEIGIEFDKSDIYGSERYIADNIRYILDMYFITADFDIGDCVLQESEVSDVKLISRDDMIDLVRIMSRPDDYKQMVLDYI